MAVMNVGERGQSGRHVLPVVQRMRAEIDEHYVRYVGPYGRMLADEAYEEWVRGGHTGPSSLTRYINLLSKFVPDAERRREFERQAASCIQVDA